MRKRNDLLSLFLAAALLTSCAADEPSEHNLSSDTDTDISEAVSETEGETTSYSSDISMTSEASANKELSDYSPYIYNITFNETEEFTALWDDEALTELLSSAASIYYAFLCGDYGDRNAVSDSESDDLLLVDGTEYMPTGYSYDSFYQYLCSAFTSDYIDAMLARYDDLYRNIDGELCFNIWCSYSTDVSFDSIVFEIESQSENEIILKGTARYWRPDEPDSERFETLHYTVVNTENGWRFDSFERWS